MKRRMIAAALLALAGIVVCQGEDTTYRVKVAVVDEGAQLIEGKFVVLPQDLRIVCHGVPKDISVGDYSKVEYKNGKFVIGKMVCDQMKWLR